MYKMIQKTIALALTSQFAFAAPPVKQDQNTRVSLLTETLSEYEASSKTLQTKGLEAFFASFPEGTFNEHDRAFISGKVKGLTKLPAAKQDSGSSFIFETKDLGKSKSVVVSLADDSGFRFLINNELIQVDEIDGVEGVYKKVSTALGLKELGSAGMLRKTSVSEAFESFLSQAHALVIPNAHAFNMDRNTLIATGLVATGIAILIYYIGKKRGKNEATEKYNDKIKKAARAANSSSSRTISEKSPVYLENPSINIHGGSGGGQQSHGTDVLTPLPNN